MHMKKINALQKCRFYLLEIYAFAFDIYIF